MIISCIGAALGIPQIYGLIQNTARLGSATTAIHALKLIAKRYLGWIGVGVAVYSFAKCMDYW